MRGRFFRRVVFLLLALFTLATGILTLVAWAAARATRVWGVELPFVAGPAALVLAFALLVVAHRLRGVASPVGDVMEAAGQLADGRYDVRVIERGPPETRRLARAFNDMAGRLGAHKEQRRHLLAEITHELKTPLAVMQGHLEGLVDGVYPRDDAHLLPVLEEIKLLSVLVDDLRTLALAETGQLPLHPEAVDLVALLRDTAAAFQIGAQAAGIRVVDDVPADLPTADVDPVRVRQVLSILLTNARQHTPRGGSIRVTAERQEKAVSIAVIDTGSGIAADDLPRLFDRFYKSADSRGSGLGLAIARNLVRLHGGQIAATSEPGRGATFRFSLPVG